MCYAWITDFARHAGRLTGQSVSARAEGGLVKTVWAICRGKEWSFAKESPFSHWAFFHMKALVEVRFCPQKESTVPSSQPAVPSSRLWHLPPRAPMALLGHLGCHLPLPGEGIWECSLVTPRLCHGKLLDPVALVSYWPPRGIGRLFLTLACRRTQLSLLWRLQTWKQEVDHLLWDTELVYSDPDMCQLLVKTLSPTIFSFSVLWVRKLPNAFFLIGRV